MEGPTGGKSRDNEPLARPGDDGLEPTRPPGMREIAGRLGRAINDPVVVTAGSQVVFINTAGERAFGYAVEELSDLTLDSLLPGTAADLEAGATNAPTQPLTCEARRKDGTTFPAQLTFSHVTLEGEFEITIVRDLTEQQRVEDELRRTRDRLAEAQRVARIGSWEWDIPANKVTWSDELFRIYGLEPRELEPNYEEFLGRVHPEDRESVNARNEKVFADHQPFDDVKRIVRPDGTTFLMRTQGEMVTDEAGQPLRMLGICEDVTVEMEAERAQAELASIVESSDDAIVATTLEGEITSWSPGAAKLYQYTSEEVLGRSVAMLVPPDCLDDQTAKVARLIAGETIEHYETSRLTKDGTRIDVSLGMSPVRRADGSLSAISTIARDIADRKRFETRLKHLADHDPLTGLANRRRFEEELNNRVAEARRYDTRGAVLMLDLDNFKYVNDALGHRAGDDLLRSVGGVLGMRVRETDMLARLGGDEFAVFLARADEAAAIEVANALLEALREHVVPIDGRPIGVTASIGIACVAADTTTGEELLADADHAMYGAKDSGRDRAVAVSAAERESHGETRLGWEHKIREALERDLFVVHCQPIMDLRSGAISQYELLLRMADGKKLKPEKLIAPGAFLGVAERLGLIHAIDRWVVDQALQLLARHPTLCLEVNLSALSLDDPPLLELIRHGISEQGIDPTRLIFEITETAAIGNTDIAWTFATALHELGCSFALDDFGAGFGSFYYLKHLPAEYLKIDGDFVSSPRSRTDELVIDSIVRIAQGLGKKTIAEHVEDEATLEALREGGVDYAQGFHIGHPAPLHVLADGQLVG
jgi:diguanylate cyclase (GGDEF)-like protein/PAS domain S-box-containing protein